MLRALLFLFCLNFALLLTVEACSGGCGDFGYGGNLKHKHSFSNKTFIYFRLYQLTYLNALNVFTTCNIFVKAVQTEIGAMMALVPPILVEKQKST